MHATPCPTGWVRLLEAVVIPFVLASLVFFISVHLASRQLRARTNHDRWELGAQKAVQRGKQRRLGRRALLKSKQGRKGLGNPGPTPAEGGRGRGGGGEREAAPGEDLPRADWSSAWEVGSGSHEVPSSASVSPGSSLANSTLSATDGPSGPDRPPTPPGTGFAPPGRPPPPGKQPALAGQWPTAAPPPQTKQTAPVFPGAAAAAAVAAGGTRGRDYCAQTWAARASTELRVAAGAGEGAGGAMLPLLDLRPHPDIINSTNDISRLVGGCATPLPRELPHRAAPVLPAQAPEPDGEHPDLDPSAGLFSV
ncbi:hypothetical protein T492DRAFT_949675 [Pavlovales sp. CCMP2436]|nr:hypothetical protein T492DRAFT_949675 [Pavlovales sp. CCMP2436]